jgi:DNA-binding MarR family transcriptional regulator
MMAEIPNKSILAKIFNALSTEARLKALELFEQKKELNEIAKQIGMSRSGFQKIVDSFRELGVIERDGHRSVYRLSREGIELLMSVKEFATRIELIKKEITKEKIRSIAFGSGLKKEDLIKLIEELGNRDE